MGILRRIKKFVISPDPDSQNVDPIQSNTEIHAESDTDDSMDSTYIETIHNQACGCFQKPGGRCSVCGANSCVHCHSHCGGSTNPHPLGCGRPLCREHAETLTLPSGTTVPFCGTCYSNAIRKHRWSVVGRMLLDSIVESEAADE